MEIAKMNVGIIGAGRAGSAFATAFFKNNINIAGIYSRTLDKAKELAGRVNSEFLELDEIVKESDIIFITVTDYAVKSVADDIINADVNVNNKFFIHTSGAYSSDELMPLREKGGITASMHPVQTFSGSLNDYKKFKGIVFGFEGDEKALKAAENIAVLLEGRLLKINKEKKPLYHAAACMASNYSIVLFNLAQMLLSECGMDDKTSGQIIEHLMRASVINAARKGSLKALTGPVSRADFKTVENHIEEITKVDEDTCDVYRKLGIEALRMAVEDGRIGVLEAENIYNILSI